MFVQGPMDYPPRCLNKEEAENTWKPLTFAYKVICNGKVITTTIAPFYHYKHFQKCLVDWNALGDWMAATHDPLNYGPTLHWHYEEA